MGLNQNKNERTNAEALSLVIIQMCLWLIYIQEK